MDHQRKHLFLLEVMVKDVWISSKLLLNSFSFDPAKITKLPVVVKVKFSDFFNVEIDQDGKLGMVQNKVKPPSTPENDQEISGKSCIFPLSMVQMELEMRKTPMYIECFSKTEGNMSPILLGRTKLNLGPYFLETLCKSRTPAFLPATSCFDITENLTNIFSEESGKMDISIRFSCFGNALLTCDFKNISPCNSNQAFTEQYIYGMSSDNIYNKNSSIIINQ